VGILQSSGCQRPPHSQPLKPWSLNQSVAGCWETISPSCADVSGAVLAPPTGTGVLNQIPAGDGRESSREQAVLDDGVPLLQRHPSQAGRPHPLIGALLDLAAEPLP